MPQRGGSNAVNHGAINRIDNKTSKTTKQPLNSKTVNKPKIPVKPKSNPFQSVQNQHPHLLFKSGGLLGYSTPNADAQARGLYNLRLDDALAAKGLACEKDSATLQLIVKKLTAQQNTSRSKEPIEEKFCLDIIEQQIGYCVNVESEERNIIKEQYWLGSKHADVFKVHREKVMLFAKDLQFKLEHFNETFLITAFIFDKFYQTILEKESTNYDTTEYCQEAWMHVVVCACFLLASKYDEIYPAPIDDFQYLLSEKCLPDSYPRGIRVEKETILEIERLIVVEIDWNFSKPNGLFYLQLYSILFGHDRDAHELSKFLLDLIYINNATCHLAPSVAAASVIMLTRKYTMENQFVWKQSDALITSYKCSALLKILKTICVFLNTNCFIGKAASAKPFGPVKKLPLKDSVLKKEVDTVFKQLIEKFPVIKSFLSSNKMKRLTEKIIKGSDE